DQRLFPPVAFLDSIKGACIVNVRGKQLWSETDVILWRGAKSLGPKLAEVLYIERAIYNRHLNAAWIGDSAMEETNALQHRTDERKLLLKPAVHHLLPGVPVREIAIEAHFGKPLDELHGPPHVLADGRAMRFDVERKTKLCRGRENALDQPPGFAIVFEPPTHVQRRALIAVCRKLLGEWPRFFRRVHAPACGNA